MRVYALLAALTLAVAPTLAAAEGCGWGHSSEQTAASCGEGKSWDATAQACVDQTTS